MRNSSMPDWSCKRGKKKSEDIPKITQKLADWTVFKGQFLNGKAYYGEMSTLNATTYIGYIANGTYNGYGKLFQNNGKVLQEGHFENGRLITPYTNPNGPKFTPKV